MRSNRSGVAEVALWKNPTEQGASHCHGAEFQRDWESTMKLSLSVRVGEKYTNKREAAISLDELTDIAVASGYHAICMRASQIGIHSRHEEVVSYAVFCLKKRILVS